MSERRRAARPGLRRRPLRSTSTTRSTTSSTSSLHRSQLGFDDLDVPRQLRRDRRRPCGNNLDALAKRPGRRRGHGEQRRDARDLRPAAHLLGRAEPGPHQLLGRRRPRTGAATGDPGAAADRPRRPRRPCPTGGAQGPGADRAAGQGVSGPQTPSVMGTVRQRLALRTRARDGPRVGHGCPIRPLAPSVRSVPRTVLYESFSGNGMLDNPEAIFRHLLDPARHGATSSTSGSLDDPAKHPEVLAEFDGQPAGPAS